MMMAENKRLMRILCIHGYRQNSKSFREKTGSLRKLLKKYIDCTFITAHHRVPPGNMGSSAWESQPSSKPVDDSSSNEPVEVASQPKSNGDEGEGERGWWFSREDDYFKSTEYSDCDKGFPKSLEQVISVLEGEDGHFDGILGFSQGAALVSILCSIQQQQKKEWFKFAVMISGFKSPSTRHNIHYDGVVCTLPTLHVFGEGDQVVSCERSEKLSEYFDNPKSLRHPGGHFVAATSAQKQTYVEFFEEMKQLCLSHC